MSDRRVEIKCVTGNDGYISSFIDELASAIKKDLALKKDREYNHYFKDVSGLDAIDVYMVCKLFDVQDNSGALQHAIKKMLCSGQRGVKDKLSDIREARDSLNRFLEMNNE